MTFPSIPHMTFRTGWHYHASAGMCLRAPPDSGEKDGDLGSEHDRKARGKHGYHVEHPVADDGGEQVSAHHAQASEQESTDGNDQELADNGRAVRYAVLEHDHYVPCGERDTRYEHCRADCFATHFQPRSSVGQRFDRDGGCRLAIQAEHERPTKTQLLWEDGIDPQQQERSPEQRTPGHARGRRDIGYLPAETAGHNGPD